ncbi:MAG: outer membrane beta-barrel protein [Terracidiphilus sp.]
MKKKLLRTILQNSFKLALAIAPASLFFPVMAGAQVSSPESQAPSSGPAAPKYEVYAGWGYTSINQVNQSRYGLMGVDLSVMRDWGKYFGLMLMGNYYKPPLKIGSGGGGVNNNTSNPGDPSVYEVIAGPEVHADIYDRLGAFVHGGLGVEHSGGEQQTPNLSFAGGFGGGMYYRLTDHFAARVEGDKIGASFSLIDNSAILANSPHRTWNSSATVGVSYHF